jgi:hypothetical protein
MVDNWEIDTLLSINLLRIKEGLEPFSWNNTLKEVANDSLFKIKGYEWEYIGGASRQGTNLEKIPQWVRDAKGWRHSYNDLVASLLVEDDDYIYAGTSWKDGGCSYSRLLKKADFQSYEITNREVEEVISSACRCPHWTPPIKIAELLWNDSIKNSCWQDGIVVIHNDNIFTFAILATGRPRNYPKIINWIGQHIGVLL